MLGHQVLDVIITICSTGYISLIRIQNGFTFSVEYVRGAKLRFAFYLCITSCTQLHLCRNKFRRTVFLLIIQYLSDFVRGRVNQTKQLHFKPRCLRVEPLLQEAVRDADFAS